MMDAYRITDTTIASSKSAQQRQHMMYIFIEIDILLLVMSVYFSKLVID